MRFLFIILIVILHFTSCQKFDKKTQFDLVIEDSFIIPSIIGISIPFINFLTPPVNTNIDEQLKIEEKKKKKIESIVLEELELSITSPALSTFSFVNDANVYISADGLPEIYIANIHNIPFTVGNRILLTTDNSLELEEYIKKDVIDLRVEITTDETILQDINVAVKATFFVDVKVLGI